MSSWSALSMALEEDEHSLEEKFAAAVKVIRSLPEEGDDLFQSVHMDRGERLSSSVQLCATEHEMCLLVCKHSR